MDAPRRRAGFYLRAAVFAGFVVFLYVPIAVVAMLSFQGPLGGMTFPMNGFSFEWYVDLVDPRRLSDFRPAFARSLALALGVMAVTVVVSFLAGMGYRRRFLGERVLFYLVVAGLIVPSVLVSLGIGLLFDRMELDPDWYTSVAGAHLTWTLPFGVLLMFAVFNRFDKSYEEAARDLGASAWQTVRKVIVPIVGPGLIGVALFAFTLSYDEFPRTSLVTGHAHTLPAEIVAVTSRTPSPTIYALGTVTTLFSFLLIALSFAVIGRIRRRRAGNRRGEAVAASITR